MEENTDKSSSMTVSELRDFAKSQDIVDVLVKCNAVKEEDVVGRKICCPFHDDKTPSLNFYEDSYYCFGCAATGDVFSYLQRAYDISFIQAVGIVADAYGKTLVSGSFNPFTTGNESRVSSSKLDSEWKGYLAAMESAPDEIKTGAEIFFPLEVGYDPEISYYVLRYTSKTGMTLGFTKRRAFETDDKARYPKWRHSSIKSSRISDCASIFNLGPAITHIRKSRHVVLVEGPKDVIPWLMSGVKETVAISGTHHINKVFETLPSIDRVTLSLDSDEAGIGGMRDIVVFLSDKMSLDKIEYVSLDGMDPYDYWQKSESMPDPSPILELFDDPSLRGLYAAAAPYNRYEIVSYVSASRPVSFTEAESLLTMGAESTRSNKKRDDEISRLSKSTDPAALRKMQLKYGVE